MVYLALAPGGSFGPTVVQLQHPLVDAARRCPYLWLWDNFFGVGRGEAVAGGVQSGPLTSWPPPLDEAVPK